MESKFQKVGECLYRYSGNGKYYARLWLSGKQVWASLKTKGREHAKRKLREKRDELERLDAKATKMTLRALCDRYLKTITNSNPKTYAGKERVICEIKKRWPRGALMRVADATDEPERFLAKYRFGPSGYNAFLTVLRELFDLAIVKNASSQVRFPISHIRNAPIRSVYLHRSMNSEQS